ncbi:unnamed protein product [Coffea canephora]|uniref:Uncharacterized protein n=1 Tax=Coffea canephora TaxID=49390 RepID=A0A068UAM0_COFCA|nr:unnamed protein product [Coffea canephora]
MDQVQQLHPHVLIFPFPAQVHVLVHWYHCRWYLEFGLDVAEEIGLPLIYFRTLVQALFWPYFCIPRLIEAGEFPFSGNDMDLPIANVKGVEGLLRRRDLPSFFRVNDLTSSSQQPSSRFVGELWKLELVMKDTCERKIVEKMIRDLMVKRKDEFLQRADEMAKLPRKSIEEGASSFCNFLCLIDDMVKG